MASGNRRSTSRRDTALSASPSPQSKKGQGKKAKAGSSKKTNDKPQSERFKEAARALGTDESGNLFERMFRKVLPPRRLG